MSEILRDISATALIAAIEDNVFDLIPMLSRWPQAEVYDGAEIKWALTRIPLAMLNSVFRARLAPHEVDATIQAVIDRASARQVPVLWWLGPQTQPADLGRYLEAHAFKNSGYEPGMAADLTKLNEDWAAPPGLSIRRVSDLEALKAWCQAWVRGFEMPGFAGEAFFDFMSCVGFETSRPYLGWLDGQPVATSLLVLAAGVAGIYNVATVPEARQKGIGTGMTLTPLQEARAMGYRVGILQASEMGASLYRRVGFEEYCQIGHYVWSPAPTP